MRGEKKPLYRKVNTRARNVHHNGGPHYRWSRGAKETNRAREATMRRDRQNGLDYTPLYRFLLSKVGEDFDEVYSEAVARLDRPDPVFHLVARNEAERHATVRTGESSYWSGLCVDDNGRLAAVDPSIKVETLEPCCPCCTHTFNGQPFVKPFRRW
jgi:hypothetical protein